MRWEVFLYGPMGQDTLLGNTSTLQCAPWSLSSLREMGLGLQAWGLNRWSLLQEVPGDRHCTYLSHMSKMKRQKEPTAMGPTCFQYPERRFRSFWS